MHTLLLMRHAKSSWSSQARSDHDRPLNGRGKRQAPWVAEQLVDRGWTPDAVVSSDARRTRETFALMQETLGDPPARFTRRLYLCDVEDLLEVIGQTPDRVATLLVLGHNPCWEEAASQLADTSLGMTTANVVALRTPADSWEEAVSGPWRLLERLVTPFRG